jgi:hypothetical protein
LYSRPTVLEPATTFERLGSQSLSCKTSIVTPLTVAQRLVTLAFAALVLREQLGDPRVED